MDLKNTFISILSIFLIFPVYAIDLNKCYKISDEFIFDSVKKMKIENVEIDIYYPEKKLNCYKLLLVLPGWNFSKERWFKETELLKYKESGYIMVAPEMKTTIYESQYFPETKLKWHKLPGMQFIKILIEEFQKQNFFKENKYNFILGLSTGGRGAVLISMNFTNIFFAVASLSGDFDQTFNPSDNLMKLVYGDYKIFGKRWEEIDNPVFFIKKNKDKWKSHIYLGHGENDNIVSYLHTKNFYEFLKTQGLEIQVKLNLVKQAKHDFHYWNSELATVFDFFENLTRID